MIRVIKQDVGDIISYQFDVEDLGGVLLTALAVKSVTQNVVVTTATVTGTAMLITVDFTACVTNTYPIVVLTVTMDNGDIEHRTIYFRIVPRAIC